MIKQPPAWQDYISSSLIQKVISSDEFREFANTIQEKYLYWEDFKYHKPPLDLSIEEAWAALKIFYRNQREKTPIVSTKREIFEYTMTKTLYERLSHIDTHTAGFIQTLTDKPAGLQKEQLIVSGLSEEAIASSQLEGASTTRRIAKEMIYSGRKPRTTSEQMIMNNYHLMKRIDTLKDLDLSEKMLLEIQEVITRDTLDNTDDCGKFREENDPIVVLDKLTGEIIFTPPSADEMIEGIKNLVKYANKEDGEGESFVHPVIKATIIHFWLAYLHPFPDGNGRTARALFYWYLRKRGYWLFEYLSISSVIKNSRVSYDNAFLFSEYDGGDLTYFLYHSTATIQKAIENLKEHYKKKTHEMEMNKRITAIYKDINERQAAVLEYAEGHPEYPLEVKTYQIKNATSYETARKDLMLLEERGLLIEFKKGKKKVYLPNISEIKKLFNRV
ncbi:MAG: Fic family protein [Candidatus Paceibacterota bacterium]|jgi:Fic family protein|nr:Fic family protein [Candidatus Paceibacterota bacterium]